MQPKDPSSVHSKEKVPTGFPIAPGFRKWAQTFFGHKVSDKVVNRIEQAMMKMIQLAIHHDMERHKKVQEEIKRRLSEQ